MKNYNNLLVAFTAILGIAIGSCSHDVPTEAAPRQVINTNLVQYCDTNNSLFNQLYKKTDLFYTNIADKWLVDHLVYEYQFNVATNKTICSIGLRHDYPIAVSYNIEITNKTTNNIVYSGPITINAGAVNYVSITPTPLIAGNNYLIRRIAPAMQPISYGLGYL
ncbi:MAG: hypothetical protein H7174_01120 [Flavobacterium sp.]|nr:hypothetical protein [Flavobacterium sp.]